MVGRRAIREQSGECATSYFHSISIASYVVAPMFSNDWAVAPSCQRKSPAFVSTVSGFCPCSWTETGLCDTEILTHVKCANARPLTV